MKDFIKSLGLDTLAIATLMSFAWLALAALPVYMGYDHFSTRFHWVHLSWYDIYIALLVARLIIISLTNK